MVWTSSAESFLTELQVNVLASIIASFATFAALWAVKVRSPIVASLIFWRRFKRDLVVIISEMPVRYDPDMKRGPQPPLTPIGDALTLAAHLQFLRRRLRAEPLVVSVQDLGLFDQFKRRNLLIIGGPKYNFAAQQCLREIDELLPYQFRRLRPETSERTVEDPELKRFVARTPETSFASEPGRDIDYGCAILVPNPYNENRKVLILAGLTTLSTLGVSQWLQQGRPLMWIRARLLDGFEAIVQCQNTGTTHVSNVRTAALVYLRKP